MKSKITIKIFALFCLCIINSRFPLPNVARAASIIDPAKIEFRLITTGLTQPLYVTNAADDSGRLFILEKAGRIRIFKNGLLLSAPFLDIRSIVNSTGSEQGLLALAFHPSYSTNGQFYAAYTDASGSLVLSRFTRSSTNPDLANSNSRSTVLAISHPTYTNHNGGTLAFGPDGYLYWSTGDGGSGGDPSNNAQNLNSLLGKILRLDVDSGSPYSIPPSNPFFNNPDPSIRKEIWAYGLRNPWRLSFDRQTGDMYIGDVGQQTREEIDFQPSNDAGGKNYGWRVMEGSLCYNPASGCDQSSKVLPIAEYDHSVGCSVTGGYVYRGIAFSSLQGHYFYGDFCTGVLFSLHRDSTNGWTVRQIADTPYFISSFGEDEDGELYFVDYAGGRIYQIQYVPDLLVPGDVSGLTATTSTNNGSVNLSWIAPADDAGNNQSGPVTSYLVKYSTSPISSENDWNNAITVSSGLPTPTAPGNPQAMVVSGLNHGTLYYFAVRAQDEQPNQSVNFASTSASTRVLAPVPSGTYDDAHAAWNYSGSWTAHTGHGPMNNTMHFTNTQNATASIRFIGTQFTVHFARYINRGSVEVWIDGVQRYTFSQNGSLAWQDSWSLPAPLSNGVHTVEFKNPSNNPATYIDIDAISIRAPVGPGTYDDAHTAWKYSGGWTAYAASGGPLNNTMHFTNVQNASASIIFTGTEFTVYFAKYLNRGSVEVWIDGALAHSFSENDRSLAWQQSWSLPTPLINGTHTVEFRNPSANPATYIDIDAIVIKGPVGPGTYDDTDLVWAYSGAWTAYTVSGGPLNNTMHFTNAQNASASITFTGTQFTVYFTQYFNRGNVEVWIDGAQAHTFNENSDSLAWQQSWTLPTPLNNGTHTVEFKNPTSNPATYIDIDAIKIAGPAGPGTYDDNHQAWAYSDGWTAYTTSGGPLNNTMHFTNAQNASASITFTGTQFTVYFTQYFNRGNVEVWIDGTLAHIFSENGSSLAWQQSWSLPAPLSNGTHTVQFRNPNASTATYIDIDAITILP